MFSQFLNIDTGSQILNQVFTRLKQVISEMQGKPILDGQILTGVTLVAGSVNKINHKLGRELVGYFVIQRSADCRIWDDHLTATDLNAKLSLRTSAGVTVNVWVF